MGIYDTTADTYANSFNGPQNGAFNNPGWQMDPNLMTPSYSAPYRPQYNGYGPYQNASNPGFFQSVGRLASPFYQPPMWQSPGQAAQPYFESMAYRPGDAVMTGMQRYAIPGLAAGAAMKYLGPNTGSIMGDITGTFTGKGVAGAFGRSMGRGLVGGAIRGFGMAGTGAISAGAIGAAGMAGSAIMGFGLPLLAAEAAASATNAVFIDPYLQKRAIGKSLRENFAGVSFAGASGDMSRSGMGLGHIESNRIAREITRSGMSDFALGTEDYTNISDMAGKSGMLDSTKHTDIAKKIKSIAEQVKLVIQISQDPSVQNAMEELSKLQQGGASLTGGMFSAASGAYSEIGMHASAAGTTVKRLMDRVGAQGQMLYGMNGMTPYLGQVAAAKTYAGFASGQRTGLIGEAQLARMGGLEGATQSAMTGAITAMQTPYAKMLAFNQYGAGATGSAGMGSNQNTAAVLSAYGQSVGQDPLEAMGGMLLFGDQMTEKAFKEHGYKGVEDMAVSNLRDRGERPDTNGHYSVKKIAMGLSYMGMDKASINAFMAKRDAETNPETVAQDVAAYRRNAREATLTQMSAENRLDTTASRTMHSVGKWWHDVKGGGEQLAHDLFTNDVDSRLGDNPMRPNSGRPRGPDADAAFWDYIKHGDSYSKSRGYTSAEIVGDSRKRADYESKVDGALGKNDFNSTDDLRVIGSVDNFARLRESTGMSEKDARAYIDKDPLLKKLVGSSGDYMSVIKDVHNRARKGGFLNQGRIAASLGGVGGDGSNIGDRGLREKFQKATTAAEKQAILQQEILRLNQGTTSEDTVGPGSDMSLSDSVKFTNNAALAGKEIVKRINSMSTSAANYQTGYSDKVKAFDAPVNDFGNSVKSFEKVIKEDLPRALGKAPARQERAGFRNSPVGKMLGFGPPDKTNNLSPEKR